MFMGKTVIITGATGGIGTAVVKLFAKHGANLALQSTSEEKLAKLKSTLALGDDKVEGFVLDITDEKAVEAMAQKTSERFGTIDILVNNAGRLGDSTPITDINAEDFERIVRINLFGPFFMTKYVLRLMKQRQSGTIVTIASTAGLYPGPLVTYTAAKHALIGMTKCVALDAIKYGERVNMIAPGAVDTPMMVAAGTAAGMGNNIDAFREAVESGIPDGRYATPDEVANAVSYFASDLSSHIIGQVLVVDGAEYLP
jgi:NAD(P)-dependent dehydrogenase (short-subunit alcohol dehydrogenase family)